MAIDWRSRASFAKLFQPNRTLSDTAETACRQRRLRHPDLRRGTVKAGKHATARCLAMRHSTLPRIASPVDLESNQLSVSTLNVLTDTCRSCAIPTVCCNELVTCCDKL